MSYACPNEMVCIHVFSRFMRITVVVTERTRNDGVVKSDTSNECGPVMGRY
jgi:hypothetical protein